MDAFRYIVSVQEKSQRAIDLTETIIKSNPGMFTVWWVLVVYLTLTLPCLLTCCCVFLSRNYRSDTITSLPDQDLAAELDFMERMIKAHLKGYQVWYVPSAYLPPLHPQLKSWAPAGSTANASFLRWTTLLVNLASALALFKSTPRTTTPGHTDTGCSATFGPRPPASLPPHRLSDPNARKMTSSRCGTASCAIARVSSQTTFATTPPGPIASLSRLRTISMTCGAWRSRSFSGHGTRSASRRTTPARGTIFEGACLSGSCRDRGV